PAVALGDEEAAAGQELHVVDALQAADLPADLAVAAVLGDAPADVLDAVVLADDRQAARRLELAQAGGVDAGGVGPAPSLPGVAAAAPLLGAGGAEQDFGRLAAGDDEQQVLDLPDERLRRLGQQGDEAGQAVGVAGAEQGGGGLEADARVFILEQA